MLDFFGVFMKIMSFNANGIRAAARKGFFGWFLTQDIDILCVQETKAQTVQLQDDIFLPAGYHRFLFDAEKKGYSGVAMYCRQRPDQVLTGLGWPCPDTEGRYIQADFDSLSVVSLYLPSGSAGDHRQAHKFEFMERYQRILSDQLQQRRSFIICGDWNIVHREIDIKNFKSNQKTSGCLPEERAWLDQLFQSGWVDAFRVINSAPHQYTWWSNRGQAWANNVGWRIDYQIVTPDLRSKVQAVSIYKDQRFSDHAPLTIEYDLSLAPG